MSAVLVVILFHCFFLFRKIKCTLEIFCCFISSNFFLILLTPSFYYYSSPQNLIRLQSHLFSLEYFLIWLSLLRWFWSCSSVSFLNLVISHFNLCHLLVHFSPVFFFNFFGLRSSFMSKNAYMEMFSACWGESFIRVFPLFHVQFLREYLHQLKSLDSHFLLSSCSS